MALSGHRHARERPRAKAATRRVVVSYAREADEDSRSHENVTRFLAGVPAERHLQVRFEDLVRDPEGELKTVCDFLGIEYHPAMADPYGAAPMADGVHAESRMLGDVKFLMHGKVDASSADRWRQAKVAPLGPPARQLAAALAYDLDAGAGAEISLARVPRDGPLPLSFAQQRRWFLDRSRQLESEPGAWRRGHSGNYQHRHLHHYPERFCHYRGPCRGR